MPGDSYYTALAFGAGSGLLLGAGVHGAGASPVESFARSLSFGNSVLFAVLDFFFLVVFALVLNVAATVIMAHPACWTADAIKDGKPHTTEEHAAKVDKLKYAFAAPVFGVDFWRDPLAPRQLPRMVATRDRRRTHTWLYLLNQSPRGRRRNHGLST